MKSLKKDKSNYIKTNINGYTVLQWCHLLKSEYETILNNKIPVKITFNRSDEIDNSVSKIYENETYIINKKINASKETLNYISYMYKKIKNMDTSEFKKIISPIGNYTELIYILSEKDILSFEEEIDNIKKNI